MVLEGSQNLTPREVKRYLEGELCKRVPDLDISFMWAYELPDSRILLEMAGEGGCIYSREELEKLVQEAESVQENSPTTTFSIELDRNESKTNNPLETTGFLDRGDAEEFPHDNVSPLLLSQEVYEKDSITEENVLNSPDSNSLPGTLVYFSKLEFYASYQKTDLSNLAEKILRLLENEGFRNSDTLTDLEILKWDEDRVWWHDLEGEVFAGNKVYVAMLKNLARISRGFFQPQAISEVWDSEEGPLQVNFSLNNELCNIQPTYMTDWIDINIVREINMLLATNDFKFEIVWTGDQMGFITMLSSLEKKNIRSQRGWNFLT